MPIAEKVLPFRPTTILGATSDDPSPTTAVGHLANDPSRVRASLAEVQIVTTFAVLQEAELRGASRRVLDRPEDAYFAEVAIYEAAVANLD